MHIRSWVSSLTVVGLLFLLSACAPEPVTSPTVSGFHCHAVVEYDGWTAEGDLTRVTAGTLTFDVTAPETLQGVNLVWNGESATVKWHGLSFDLDPKEVPACAVGNVLLGALDAAVGTTTGERTDEGIVTKGTFASGEYTIVSDAETGALLSLSVPSYGLTARFSNFEIFS